MNVRELFTVDRAVSPVIGVILMVAITVILAAVIGAFVLNLGDNQAKAPQTKINFDQNTETLNSDLGWGVNDTEIVTIKPLGGETMNEDQIDVRVNAGQAYNDSSGGEKIWSGSGKIRSDARQRVAGFDSDDDGSVDAALHEDDEVIIVWTAESGESSSKLAEYTVE